MQACDNKRKEKTFSIAYCNLTLKTSNALFLANYQLSPGSIWLNFTVKLINCPLCLGFRWLLERVTIFASSHIAFN